MSNTLKLGNGKWATGKDTLLSFSDTNNNYKPLPFSFSRASSGTVINKDGLIETVGTGTPRIDFKDNTKGSLLLEPQRANLVPYSKDFTQWNIQSGTTVTSNTTDTLSPSGEYDASKVVGSGTSGILKSSVSSSGGTNTKSIYLKGISGGEQVKLKDPNQTVNQKTLTLTTQWQRYTLTESQTSSFGIWIDDIPTSGIYMWGAQVESGSYATSYIPTSGSAVTRVADACNNGANEQVINSTEGVLYANFYAEANDTEKWISLSDGTSTNRVIVYIPIANTLRIYVQNSSGSQADFGSSITLGQYNKVAFKYKNNDFALFLNGTKVGTDTNGGVPIGLDRLNFADSNGTTNPFIGNVKDVRVYNTALTDQELAALTTI